MKIEFWALGKSHEPYVKPGVDDFTARIQNYHHAEWRIFSPKKYGAGGIPEKWKQMESDLVLAALKPEDYLVALDEKGKSMSSVKLSEFVQDRANDSVKRLVFLIGGAYGLDEKVFEAARLSWSLSALTFPHQMVRLILAEQIYRACSILRNERYHHA